MKTTENSAQIELQNQVLFYKQENESFKVKIQELETSLNEAKQLIEWFKKQIFGKKSERFVSSNNHTQMLAFEMDPIEEVKTTTIQEHSRCKPNRSGQDKIAFPEDLPVERVVIDIPDSKKVVEGKPLVKIGEEVTQQLAYKPEEYYIKEIVRLKYRVNGETLISELPDSIISKCHVDESFLAKVAVNKFCDHLPLYRISEQLARCGINVHRKLLSQWMVRCGLTLKPLVDVMLEKILESKNIFVDETPVKFIEEESRQGYIWVICGGSGPNPPYRVYDFKENRKHKNITDLLNNYTGVLHSDKYGAYENLANQKRLTWQPCFAHIRRKFFEAEDGDPPFKEWILNELRNLFLLEQEAWKFDEEGRLDFRKEREERIVDELIKMVNEKILNGGALPKSKFREALYYFKGLMPYAKNFLRHPNARIDNSVAERAIRPIAIGRKNWLFFGSQNGGVAGCALLSLLQTCRGLGINPQEYLEDTMRLFMGYNYKKIDELLPDQWARRNGKDICQPSSI